MTAQIHQLHPVSPLDRMDEQRIELRVEERVHKALNELVFAMAGKTTAKQVVEVVKHYRYDTGLRIQLLKAQMGGDMSQHGCLCDASEGEECGRCEPEGEEVGF